MRPETSVKDRQREGVPLRQELLRLDLLSLANIELRTVGQRVPLTLTPRVVDDHEFAVAVHDHQVAALVGIGRFRIVLLNDLDVLELDESGAA
jgi:hypothetical protein